MEIFFYKTTIGYIGIEENGTAITRIFFPNKGQDINCGKETELIQEAGNQLEEYLTGRRRQFDLPLAPKGTEFQKAVWNALLEIPYGETRSYKQIAEQIGNPKAMRAVGLANNRNPIVIMIPCHRVIGTDGRLVGYGGGVELKQKLLLLERHEGVAIDG